MINSDCYYCTDDSTGSELNYIISDVTIDTSHSQFNECNCGSIIVSEVFYLPAGSADDNGNYIAFPTPPAPE